MAPGAAGRERAWALALARAEGASIRTLAAAAGLLPARVHQITVGAANQLAELLAGRGELDAWADADDEAAASRLPALLIKQGQGEEAERLRRFSLNPDGRTQFGARLAVSGIERRTT